MFGGSEEKNWPMTFGVNAKGGMYVEEFGKSVANDLVPLFSDSGDVPGKIVIIKVESGPGCLNVELIPNL